MGFTDDFTTGDSAVAILAKRLLPRFYVRSTAGTEEDFQGIDYHLIDTGVEGSDVTGSHKHTTWRNQGKYPVRYQRHDTGLPTDFQKISKLPKNHVMSVSYGSLNPEMPIVMTNLKSVLSWIEAHTNNIRNYVDENAFPNASVLYIPLSELAWTKVLKKE